MPGPRVILLLILLSALVGVVGYWFDQQQAAFSTAPQTGYEQDFMPPSDGVLREDKLLAYMNIQLRYRELLSASHQQPQVCDLVPAIEIDGDQSVVLNWDCEFKAAIEQGYSPMEYQWIKNQVIEAGTLLLLAELYEVNKAIIERLELVLTQREKQLADGSYENEWEAGLLTANIKEIKSKIATMKDQLERHEQQAAAKKANIELVNKHARQLHDLGVLVYEP